MRPVLTCGFGPTALAWSPDGTRLAFAYGGCETVLYLVDLDGALTRIADGRSPAWSPDGSRLVFAPNTPFCMGVADCGEPPEPGGWSLQVVDAAGGAEPEPLSLDPALVSAGQPHFSHDGTQIAFSGPLPDREADPEIFGAAYAMAADGTNPRLVARGAWSAGWLPDGRLLVVEEKTGDVHAIDLPTGNSEALGGDVGPAVVSPDGSRLLLTSTDEVTGASRVHMATTDGDAVAALEGYPAAWSPDSSVAVVIESDEVETAMVFVGRDGEAIGRYAQAADSSFIGNVAWRPGS
jgi:dipeptidyl aminopeptidase/acylaminoacyl peptidase